MFNSYINIFLLLFKVKSKKKYLIRIINKNEKLSAIFNFFKILIF